ncbi:chitin deacetylase [Mortierella antarctica]|nr:chitin deacetylase [Mortierella antarctica]
MLFKLSLIALVTLASAAASARTSTSAASKPTAAPLLPIPAFNGTFANAYPPVDETAPTDTPLVKQWLAELNLTAVPNFPPTKFNSDGDLENPNSVPADACDWTVTNCINKDITNCPKGTWGLTYDDGPTKFSPRLYDFLDTTDQKATLFYIGSNVVTNWQATRRACAAGHHIAVHTWSHNPSTTLTNEQFVAEIKYTELAIKELCGFTPTYFRPPYGDIDNRIRGLLAQMGYTSVIWDIDTDDWMMAPGGRRTEAQVDAAFDQWVAGAANLTEGHVCLEHELYWNTVNAAIKNLPKIQKTWKAMPVAACVNDAHPYQEKNITLATLDGAKTGVAGNETVTTAGSSATSSGTSATVAATGAGKSSGAAVKSLSASVVAAAAVTIAAASLGL